MCRLPACGHRARREGHHGTSTNHTVVPCRYSTVYYQTSPTKSDGVSESVLCSYKHAVGDTQSRPPVLAQRCAPYDLESGLELRTGVRNQRCPEAPRQPEKAVTCGENQAARNQTVDAPSVHQQNARRKTPIHAHGADNHTMDTTGTCNPEKLGWQALTWKPTTNAEHSDTDETSDGPQFLKCRTKDAHNTRSDQRTHTSRNISYLWENMILLPKKDARCPRNIAPATCDTCDKQKKKDSGNTSPKTSIHHVTRALNKDVNELVLHVQNWPGTARRKTQGTETNDTNDARGHHA